MVRKEKYFMLEMLFFCVRLQECVTIQCKISQTRTTIFLLLANNSVEYKNNIIVIYKLKLQKQ